MADGSSARMQHKQRITAVEPGTPGALRWSMSFLFAVRLMALAAIPGGPGELAPPVFDLVRTYLDREQAVTERSLASDVISRALVSVSSPSAISRRASPLRYVRDAVGLTDATGAPARCLASIMHNARQRR